MKLDKLALRARYERMPVDDPTFTRGHKGRYTLGVGSFGKVKAARDTRTGDHVVIKSQAKIWRRTLSERIIHGGLELPHVVRCLDVATGPRKRYLVLERCVPLRADEALPVAKAVDLSRQLLSAVQSLHDVGVYHRDIALRNIYTQDDVLKLSDFGLAVSQPTRVLQRTYEREDALDACRVIARLLLAADRARGEAFVKWYRCTGELTLPAIAAAPALQLDTATFTSGHRGVVLHGMRRLHMQMVRAFLPMRFGPPAAPQWRAHRRPQKR